MTIKGILDKLKSTYEKRLCFFVGAVLIYSMLFMITPFVYLAEVTFLSRVAYLAILLGVCWLALEGLFTKHVPRRTPLFGYIVLFGLCLAAGVALNYQSYLFDNIKSMAFELSLLVVFFTAGSVLHANGKMGLFAKKLQSVSLVVWTGACFVSLMMFFVQCSEVVAIPGAESVRRQGYVEGRLFGVFQDPNYAAVFSLILVVVTLYFFAQNKVRYKAATVISLVVIALYLIGADSRTTYVCALLAFACYMVVVIVDRSGAFKKKGLLALKSVGMLVLAVVLVVCVSAAMGAYSEFMQVCSAGDLSGSGRRTDANMGNISNNRFEIWASYLTSIDSDSALFGRGYRGYTEQVADLYPFSYIASSQYEAHNGYILLLSATGIFGFVIWVVLIAKIVVRMLMAAVKGILGPLDSVCLAAIFGILLVKAFFFTSLWFVNEFDTYLFALLIGFAWIRCSSDAQTSPSAMQGDFTC